MQYFALLISREQDRTPEDPATAMAAWQNFHAKAGSAIKSGDALAPAAAAAVITGGPDAPVVTDGPFAESAEQLSGFYLVSIDDEAALLEAAQVLVSAHRGVEIRPVESSGD